LQEEIPNGTEFSLIDGAIERMRDSLNEKEELGSNEYSPTFQPKDLESEQNFDDH
jgi:hypothetical protein